MKKIAAIALVLCLVFAFAACGGEDTPSSVSSKTASEVTSEVASDVTKYYDEGEWPDGELGKMLPKPKAGEISGCSENSTTVECTIGVGAKAGEYYAQLQEAGFDKNLNEYTENGKTYLVCENDVARVTVAGSGTVVSVKLVLLSAIDE